MSRKAGLVVVIAFHAMLGLLYDLATPIFEASDEGHHYGFVQWVANGNELPIQEPGHPTTWWKQEGSQPPLYYLLASTLVRPLATEDFGSVFVRNPVSRAGIPGTTHNVNLYRHPLDSPPLGGTVLAVRVVRWFSLVLSCFTVFLAFHLALLIFKVPLVGYMAAAIVAFNPMVLFINASVNNDNLLMLFGAATLTVLARQLQDEQPSLTRSATLGVLLGGAALTKLSGLTLWPVVVVMLGYDLGWRRADRLSHRDLGPMARHLVLIVGIGAIIAGWWYVRNLVLYDELFGTRVMVEIAGARPPITLWSLINDEARGFFLSFWGVFGAFSILASDWVYRFFEWFSVLAGVGLVVAVLRLTWSRRRDVLLGLMPLFLLLVLTTISLLAWTLQTYASQGRLLFGALAAIGVLLSGGLYTLLRVILPFPPMRAMAGWGVIVVLIGIALYVPLVDIAPAYRPPRVLTVDELPNRLRRVDIRVVDTLQLIGYTYDQALVQPGATQRVTFYWRVLKATPHDFVLGMSLAGQANQVVSKIDSWPGGGLAPTSQLAPGQIIEDTHHYPVASHAQEPSLLRLDISFWHHSPGQRLPIQVGTERRTSVRVPVGRLVRFEEPILVDGLAHFGESIVLRDSEWRFLSGDLQISTTWTATETPDIDYTIFVHLLDESGSIVAQKDAPPLHGDWPTTAWLPHEPVRDTRRLDLPALSPGEFQLAIGIYEPESGQRLPATTPGDILLPSAAYIVHIPLPDP